MVMPLFKGQIAHNSILILTNWVLNSNKEKIPPEIITTDTGGN